MVAVVVDDPFWWWHVWDSMVVLVRRAAEVRKDSEVFDTSELFDVSEVNSSLLPGIELVVGRWDLCWDDGAVGQLLGPLFGVTTVERRCAREHQEPLPPGSSGASRTTSLRETAPPGNLNNPCRQDAQEPQEPRRAARDRPTPEPQEP